MGMNLVGWVDMAAGTRVILGYLRFAYLHEAPEIAKNNPGRDPNGFGHLCEPLRSGIASLASTPRFTMVPEAGKALPQDRGPRSNPHDLSRDTLPPVATIMHGTEHSVVQFEQQRPRRHVFELARGGIPLPTLSQDL